MSTRKVEIVKRSELHRFVVLLKRWIFEGTSTWITDVEDLANELRSMNVVPHVAAKTMGQRSTAAPPVTPATSTAPRRPLNG